VPELPEVESLRRHLIKSGLVGRTVVEARLDWRKAVREPDPDTFSQAIRGRCVEGIERRAKYLLIRLDGPTLVVHLRMTGNLILESTDTEPARTVRNAFVLDDNRELRFHDFRKLGQMWLLDDTTPLLSRLGPEPLDPEFTAEVLLGKLRRSAPIKPVLLEQDVLAGVGNIYADEALWCAKIGPLRPAQELSVEEVTKLHGCLQVVLTEATDRLADAPPFSWPSSESFKGPSVFHVPRREGEMCSRCEGPIAKRTIRGRSAYFCPACQQN
jgi:formamidopyrimidine-DNA glycosylase